MATHCEKPAFSGPWRPNCVSTWNYPISIPKRLTDMASCGINLAYSDFQSAPETLARHTNR